MNGDDIKSLPATQGLRLLGIIGGLTPQPSVAAQPVATLIQWQALKTPTGAIHLIGYCIERGEGRVSTAVMNFDLAARSYTTASGRIYVLSGQPGRNSDAGWVWVQFAAANGITEMFDVTGEFELARGGQP